MQSFSKKNCKHGKCLKRNQILNDVKLGQIEINMKHIALLIVFGFLGFANSIQAQELDHSKNQINEVREVLSNFQDGYTIEIL